MFQAWSTWQGVVWRVYWRCLAAVQCQGHCGGHGDGGGDGGEEVELQVGLATSLQRAPVYHGSEHQQSKLIMRQERVGRPEVSEDDETLEKARQKTLDQWENAEMRHDRNARHHGRSTPCVSPAPVAATRPCPAALCL